eukprot:Gregarina_sp_Pseudo_9__5920@NODE_943_length_2044_cov_34_100748_g884_i0_p1_GENE_NODE_943_length_2044_cov_34_100748_g884_i0NODE_943_length_2044_cov_34_100748_g884_i0_p1_ORF_typecomplete_len572_score104_50_NODE_943_length_2044_cov_34_100748_g884_i0951810
MHQINVNESGTYAAANAELGVQLARARSIWHAYLKGQLANVAKAALWWSTFGIIAVAMLQSHVALAATRGPFNLALLLSSPLAAAAAEKWSIKSLLLLTTSGRFLIWSFLIPLSWIVFGNYLQWQQPLWVLFISFMFFDGIQVAFSNAVDIDCGGLDSLSSAYDLPLTDFLRYRFTTVHQLIFDSSFILFTPPIVLVLVLISQWLEHHPGAIRFLPPEYIAGPDISVFVLALGVASVFGFLSLLSLRYYIKGIPIPTSDLTLERQGLAQSLSSEGSARRVQWTKDTQAAAPSSLWASYKEKMSEVADGFLIVTSDSSLKWRLVLLAAETALEDTMVSVVIPMTAIHSTAFLGHTSSKTVAALISVIIIAVGKLGGVLAGVYLASSWSYDTAATASGKRLFQLVFLSSLSLVLLPIGFELAAKGLDGQAATMASLTDLDMSVGSVFQWLAHRSGILGCITVLLGVFLFFIFSTAPKIGFASLIQTLVTHEDDVAKVFGFVGMFVTVTDGLMIALINIILFWSPTFQIGLWIVFGFYAIHGLLEYMFGSKLIQESSSSSSRIRAGLAYRADYD